MKKYITLIIAAIISTACGSQVIQPRQFDVIQVDPALRSYAEDFMVRCEASPAAHICNSLLPLLTEVTVDPSIPTGTLGLCVVWSRSLKRQIRISPEALRNPLTAEQTVFHEFGHCLLDADHVAAQEHGVHTMNPFINHVSVILANRDAMLKSLFSFIIPIKRDFRLDAGTEDTPTIPCNHK
jgi:hypothetical protein